jgi:hypothetical protein
MAERPVHTHGAEDGPGLDDQRADGGLPAEHPEPERAAQTPEERAAVEAEATWWFRP